MLSRPVAIGATLALISGTALATPKETVLLSFPANSGGFNPVTAANLVADAAGNFYGVATSGAIDCTPTDSCDSEGSVFRLSRDKTTGAWSATTIYAFDGSNGYGPFQALSVDAKGNLIGANQAFVSSSNFVNLFRINAPASATPTADSLGQLPDGYTLAGYGVTLDGAGNIYAAATPNAGDGPDILFALRNTTAGYKPATLAQFPRVADPAGGGGTVGQFLSGPPVLRSGRLYATLTLGAAHANCAGTADYGAYCGEIVSVSTRGGAVSHVYAFQGGADACQPTGKPLVDKSGFLYVVFERCAPIGTNAAGYGGVYQLVPPASGTGPWSGRIIYNYAAPDGRGLNPNLVLMGNAIFGSTSGYWNGRGAIPGSVWKLAIPAVPATGNFAYSQLYSFTGTVTSAGGVTHTLGSVVPDGAVPAYTPLGQPGATLFGYTFNGGANGTGVFYSLTAK